MKKLITIIALTASLLNAETILNINLNETDLEIGVENINKYSKNTTLYSSIAALKAENEIKEENTMIEGELMAIGLTAIPGFSVGLGAKAIATAVEIGKKDYAASGLSLKVKALYTLPFTIRTNLHGSYAYAPTSLSLSEMENYKEARVQLDVEIIDGGLLYVGYRNLQIKFTEIKEDYEFNESTYFGIKFVFK